MNSSNALKRIYKTVTVEKDSDGFHVLLDGRKLKSPAKRNFALPTQSLAKALAEEWNAQGEHIDPQTMPLMALASTAVDRIGQLRDGVVDQIAKYAETDLICYWTDDPQDLAIRQAEAWTPHLKWVKDHLGVELKTQTGVLHLQQPQETLDAFRKTVESFNDWELSGLSISTHCTGSLVLGLALIKGHIDHDRAFEDSQLDETYQIEKWGEDWEAADRRAVIRRDLKSVVKWMELIRG
ncbi:MAG: ATPase [Methylocystaceae bacterium]|nr:ATPase [Methylocystaceae bacterium]